MNVRPEYSVLLPIFCTIFNKTDVEKPAVAINYRATTVNDNKKRITELKMSFYDN